MKELTLGQLAYIRRELSRLGSLFDTILYVGKNTDAERCGVPELFCGFLFKHLVQALPSREQTVVHYTGNNDLVRPPRCEEELAGLVPLNGSPLPYGALSL